jgi:hypothetical protein
MKQWVVAGLWCRGAFVMLLRTNLNRRSRSPMNYGLNRLLDSLPIDWIENYVAAFEAGRVQKHPQARFVNARGECCIIGALAGAADGIELTKTPVWSRFLGTVLEELSRRFESRRITGQQFYEEAVLALVARRSVPAELVAQTA